MATAGKWSLLVLFCFICEYKSVMTTRDLCTKSCLNGGCCVWSGNTTYCACPHQSLSDSCELICNKNLCAGGRCIIYQSSSMCFCLGGYNETMCSTNCTGTLCQNNGSCSTDVYRMLMCNCTEEYSGSRCEVNKTEIIDCRGIPCHKIVTQNCTQKSEGTVMCDCRTNHTVQDERLHQANRQEYTEVYIGFALLGTFLAVSTGCNVGCIIYCHRHQRTSPFIRGLQMLRIRDPNRSYEGLDTPHINTTRNAYDTVEDITPNIYDIVV